MRPSQAARRADRTWDYRAPESARRAKADDEVVSQPECVGLAGKDPWPDYCS